MFIYFHHATRFFLIITLLISQGGCAEVRKVVKRSWHEKFNWKAELYFEDPQVIALCKAIEAEDLQEIDRLVTAGADVNAKGKGNMTPLLWAFPDNKPERFKRLLEHGADPNVIFKSDFNTSQTGSFPGGSVTHMASETSFPNYFDYVFQYGGDPNLEKHSVLGRGETPLFAVIRSLAADKDVKIQRLFKLGADLDHISIGMEITPAQLAVGRTQFDIALQLVKIGANHKVYMPNTNKRLVHVVIRVEHRLPQCSPQQKSDYNKLVQWLKEHGEDLGDASTDLERWGSWSKTRKANGKSEYRRKLDAEIAARKTREKRVQKALKAARQDANHPG